MCSKTPRVSHLKPSKATPFLSEVVGSQGLPFLVKALSMESHGPHELSSSRTCDRFRSLLLTCINHYKYLQVLTIITYWPLLTSINHYQLLLTSKLTEAAGMGGTLRWCAPEVLGGDEQRHGWATAVGCHSWMMYCDIRDEHLPSVLTFTIATGFELIAVLTFCFVQILSPITTLSFMQRRDFSDGSTLAGSWSPSTPADSYSVLMRSEGSL